MVGRMPDNDIVLDDPSISRKHARIEWNGQRVKIVDLATKSGTLLNSQPVAAESPQTWQPGQEVRIGSFTLRLSLGSSGTVNVTIPSEFQHLMLTPGVAIDVPVTVQNRRMAPDTFMITIDEWPANWIADPVQPVVVKAGTQASTSIRLLVPEGAVREAGSYSVKICAIGQNRPDSLDTTTALWRIIPAARPAVQVAIDPERGQGREQARFILKLTNSQSQSIDVMLSAQDEKQQLAYSFAQSRLSIGPSATVDVAMTVRSSGGRVFGGALTHTFTVSASVIGGETQSVAGSFIQTSLLPI
jgi:predicted component of type VI protein secretion system